MKKENNLKIIIALLTVIIVVLIGFIAFFIYEFIDEREEIRDLYDYNDRIYDDSNDKQQTNNNNTNIINDDVNMINNDNNMINNDTNIVNDDNNSNITNNSNYISKEKALDIALNNAKISQNNIRNIEVELDYKYGETVYEVTFDYQQYEYEYYINAENGNILKSFREID